MHPHVRLDKGVRLTHGYEVSKGKKDKQYAEGGKAGKSFGIFTDRAKADEQAEKYNGKVKVLEAKTVPAHIKPAHKKHGKEIPEKHIKERHYPERYMVTEK